MATDPYLPRLQAKRFELEDIWGRLGLAHNLDAQAPILDQLQIIKKEMIEQGFNSNHSRELAYQTSLERALGNRIVPILPASNKLSPKETKECLLGLWRAWQERLSYWLGQGKIPSEQGKLLRGSSEPVELPSSSRQTRRRELFARAKSVAQDEEPAARNEETEGPGAAEVERAMQEIDETPLETLLQGGEWQEEPDSELDELMGMEMAERENPVVDMLDTDDLLGQADQPPEMPTLGLTSDGKLQIPTWTGPLPIDSAEPKLTYNADVEIFVGDKDSNTQSFMSLSTLLPSPHDPRLQSSCGLWVDSSQLDLTHFVRALKNLGWLKAGQSIWWNARPLELTWVESTVGQTRVTNENLTDTVWKSFDGLFDDFRGTKTVSFAAAGDELPMFTIIIRDAEVDDDPDLRKLFEAADEKDVQAEFIERELRRNENGFKLALNAQGRE